MSDLIERQAAIDAIEEVDWYHQNKNKDMVSGANSSEHQAWYKADDIYKTLEALPSIDAAPVVRCKDCKHLNIVNKVPLYAYCGKSNYIFHLFEEDTREHFCSWGERREDGAD